MVISFLPAPSGQCKCDPRARGPPNAWADRSCLHSNLSFHLRMDVPRKVSWLLRLFGSNIKELTSWRSVHWIVPIIGTAFFAPGFYLTFQSILNYLGESYPRHVASVFAGNTFFRSSFGGALPLAAPHMLNSLGIGWASSTLGFISVAMVPLPFILQRVRWAQAIQGIELSTDVHNIVRQEATILEPICELRNTSQRFPLHSLRTICRGLISRV